MKLEDLLTPSGFKDFMEINYSSTVQQMAEKEVSEIEFLDYLINSYNSILDTIISNDIENNINSDIIENQCLLYRKSIEELISKKNTLLGQKMIEEKIELLNNQGTDYSEIKAKQKIIYLHELGILDFIRNSYKNVSVLAIAEILSAITGENTTTLQPYINPIFNKANSQDRNPLSNTENVERVNNHLNRKGFK